MTSKYDTWHRKKMLPRDSSGTTGKIQTGCISDKYFIQVKVAEFNHWSAVTKDNVLLRICWRVMTSTIQMFSWKNYHVYVTERKQINMGTLLTLSEGHMRALLFLQLFCRSEIFFSINFLKSLRVQGTMEDMTMDQTTDPAFQDQRADKNINNFN